MCIEVYHSIFISENVASKFFNSIQIGFFWYNFSMVLVLDDKLYINLIQLSLSERICCAAPLCFHQSFRGGFPFDSLQLMHAEWWSLFFAVPHDICQYLDLARCGGCEHTRFKVGSGDEWWCARTSTGLWCLQMYGCSCGGHTSHGRWWHRRFGWGSEICTHRDFDGAFAKPHQADPQICDWCSHSPSDEVQESFHGAGNNACIAGRIQPICYLWLWTSN